MEEWQTRNYKIVRAIYEEPDANENFLHAEPVGYAIDGEEYGSLEELAFKLETIGEDTDLYLDMNDREVVRLCRIRREIAGK